jgi:hypothetical protein
MTFSGRKGFAFILVASIGVGSQLEACSSSGGPNAGNPRSDGGNPSSSGEGGVNAVSTQPGSCADPTLPIAFTPMYSAFIPGNTLLTFSIPAVRSDGNPATWSLSDPTQALLHAESFVAGGATTPGVLVTMKGTGGSSGPGRTGQVTLFAQSGTACGASVLTITQNTDDDWAIGSARYNDGVSLHLAPAPGASVPADGGFLQSDGGTFFEQDGGTPCRTCHSQAVTNGQYHDVAHTPEQAGGFSDTDLQNIILHAEVPDGGYFDPSVITPTCTTAGTTLSPSMAACGLAADADFKTFHTWSDLTPDQIPGMICYLRSLTPEGQSGTSNFGAGTNK